MSGDGASVVDEQTLGAETQTRRVALVLEQLDRLIQKTGNRRVLKPRLSRSGKSTDWGGITN